MDKEELAKEIVKAFLEFKKTRASSIVECMDLKHNEVLILFLIKDMARDGKVSLSGLRDKIKLAPSTVTPIINSLEEYGLITRNIDKEDRRNIYISLSKKGKEYTIKAYNMLTKKVIDFINYLGEEDSEELVRLISKTSKYIKERKDK